MSDDDFKKRVEELRGISDNIPPSTNYDPASDSSRLSLETIVLRFFAGAIVVGILCLIGCNFLLLNLSVAYPNYVTFLGVVCAATIGGLLTVAAAFIRVANSDS